LDNKQEECMSTLENKAAAVQMIQFMERASWIRKMFEEGARLKAEHGEDKVCDFSLGNPDLPPPEAFLEHLERHASVRSKGIHSYMPNAGFHDVREKISGQVEKDHGVRPGADNIIMTCGAAGGLNIIFKAILNPGDEVITPTPYFVEYGFYVNNHGGELVTCPTANDLHLDFDAIQKAITYKTRAILINSPNNPSGVIYSREEIKTLASILEDVQKSQGRPVFLVSDEPYRRLVFDDASVPSIMDCYNNAIVTTSFSKDLSIPGERIGYVAVHPDASDRNLLVGALVLANRILGYVNAPALMQRVVADTLDVHVDVSIYERRRNLFAKILEDAGFEFAMPQGAFYFFPVTPIPDDTKFAAILQEELILSVPGAGFGAPGHIRLAFCVDDEVIERSADGFRRAVEKARNIS
jgi:aspartate aminotransferase